MSEYLPNFLPVDNSDAVEVDASDDALEGVVQVAWFVLFGADTDSGQVVEQVHRRS